MSNSDTLLSFEALSIEGGLLSAEWLAKAAALLAGAQTEPDCRIPKGLTIRHEIDRYWRIAQAHHADFVAGIGKADAKPLAEKFVTALLRDAFGFASLAAVGPVALGGRTYPIGHAAIGGHVPVVMAKAGHGLEELDSSY